MLALITPYVDGVLIVACCYAIITLGLQFTLASGQFSVAHAALAGLGGYASGVASINGGWPFPLALLAGIVIGLATGAVLAGILRRTSGVLLGTVTIAIGQSLAIIMRNLDHIGGVDLGGSQGLAGIPPRTSLPWAAGCLVVSLTGVLALRRSTVGLSILAVGNDETVARSLGVSIMSSRLWGFAVGGALAGLGGALVAHNNGIVEPKDLSFASEPLFFIFLMVGGLTTPWGAVFGAFAVWWLQELLRFPWTENGQFLFLDQQDRYWILGVVLVVVVLFRQKGLIVRRPLRAPVRVDGAAVGATAEAE